MGPFWGSFFDQFKSCGRERGFAAFFGAFGFMFFVLVVSISLKASDFDHYAGPFLAICGLWAVVWCAVAFRRAWLYHRQRLGLSKLSSDELAKARSKLKNGFAAVNRFRSIKPAPRVPDTDLKY